ncbi:hypothetical protein [Tessaracoccus oleiagri]|uniref:Uncharacterized protein n=1 Tax=Tessaracoccus oleiagri TaxID=686624 RepID=A0A1G9HSQ7_9ACTN|nr:hypothetical protein [Tessaracoccus oleiagri]SDL16021.1 hypothetical protein SAMN04488242_0504 [Tessaracoccus oleiagri]
MSRTREERLWRSATGLGVVATALAVALIFVVPTDLPGVRLLAVLAVVGALAVTAMAIGQLRAARGQGGTRDAGRWSALLLGLLGAAGALVAGPMLGDFAAPLGSGAAVVVQVVLVVFALAVAAIGIWGFVRRS